jgi:methionyl-tRNA synthetase
VNSRPHLGHAYTTLIGDFFKKYALMRGKEVFFLTGTDEHGEKIAQKAEEEGIAPLEFVNRNSNEFKSAWKKLDINNDGFYRTTQASHYKMVQSALSYLMDKGEIYYAEYEGKYCVGCERFRTDQEWNSEGLCPDHLKPPVIRKEPNYFFKMGQYQKQIIEFYNENPHVIQPAHYRNEVLAFLEKPLEDLNISRPKERLSWGIPLPFDDKYVTYVWFDALLNYLGGIGYEGKAPGKNPNFNQKLWLNCTHLIGKDILKTHAIYWPAMLLGLDLPLFQHLYVNGFWLTSGMKMSKSLGNVVDPLELAEIYGTDYFRYFLISEMSYGADANFTGELFVNRCNADLANGLGNLASRTLTLVHKNFGPIVPSHKQKESIDDELIEKINGLAQRMAEEFDQARLHLGIKQFQEAVALCDRYINDTKPWALAKDPTQHSRLASVLRTALECLGVFSVVSYAFLPNASLKLQTALGLNISPENCWNTIKTGLLKEGSSLGEIPRLFPRIEIQKS